MDSTALTSPDATVERLLVDELDAACAAGLPLTSGLYKRIMDAAKQLRDTRELLCCLKLITVQLHRAFSKERSRHAQSRARVDGLARELGRLRNCHRGASSQRKGAMRLRSGRRL